MEDYSRYDIAEFVADSRFTNWVKYGEQDAFWKAFLMAHPHRQAVVEQASAFILAAAGMPVQSPGESQRRHMWEQIAGEISREASQPMRSRQVYRYWWWGAAAAAVVAGIIAIPLFMQRHTKPDYYAALLHHSGISETHRTEAENYSQKPLWVALPDGSSAVLAPGARLSYADDFNRPDQREVYLSGAAFFEVNKRASHPFVVYANTLAIKVLGTSFSVQAPGDRPDVLVNVKSGKVMLYASNNKKTTEGNPMIVEAHQQAGIKKGMLYVVPVVDSVQSAPVAETTALSVVAHIPLTFEDASLPEVFTALEEGYGITIHYDKETMAHCRLTAFLSDEPLPEKIRLICKAIQAPYVIDGNEITIQGKGCK